MAAPPAPATSHEAVAASLRVVESAIELARAEAKLAAVRARALAAHAVALVLGGIVAMTFAALSLVILTLTPLALGTHAVVSRTSWPVALSFALSLLIAGAGAKTAQRALNALKADDSETNRTGGGSR